MSSNDPLSEARYKYFLEMQKRKAQAEHARSLPESHKINFKFSYMVVIFMSLAIPTTLVLLNQQQDVRQQASSPEPTLSVPTETPIPTLTPTLIPTETPIATITPKLRKTPLLNSSPTPTLTNNPG